jgi:UDP-N-acetylglucosamine 2-epimerase (non-hydrolysing)
MLGSRRMVLITGHRRENHGAGLVAICSAIVELAKRHRDVAFLLPVHLNPHVRQTIFDCLSGRPNIFLLPPVAYPEFVWLMDRSSLIITDSGGVQEEAPSLGKPVLVTRESTERPEAIECAAAKLVATDVDVLVSEANKVLDRRTKSADARQNLYGDGLAAKRVVDAMLAKLP